MLNYLTGKEREVKPPKYPRCEHGVELYCRKCLEEMGILGEEEEKQERAEYRYTLREEYYLITERSFGCLVCDYHTRRLAASTLRRYAARKGWTCTEEDIKDALQSALEYILKHPEEWRKTCQQAREQGVPEHACFARLVRARLKNIIRSYVKHEDNTISLDCEESEHVLTQYGRQRNDYAGVENALMLESILTQEEYNIVRLSIAGYSQQEIARKLRKSQQAISKRMQKIRAALVCADML